LSRALFHFSINLIRSMIFSIVGLTMEARFGPSSVCMEFVLEPVEPVFLLFIFLRHCHPIGVPYISFVCHQCHDCSKLTLSLNITLLSLVRIGGSVTVKFNK